MTIKRACYDTETSVNGEKTELKTGNDGVSNHRFSLFYRVG